MCTLTILPESEDGMRFTAMMNRDELKTRKKALPPVWQDGILAPRDADAGGTWTAMNESGLIGFVLNRTKAGDRQNTGSISRGHILPALLKAHSVNDTLDLWPSIPLSDMKPFYCLLRDRHEQHLYMFNGKILTRRSIHVARPLLLATSGLGDSLVRHYRKSLFADLLLRHPDRAAQKEFHQRHDPLQPTQSVMMMRDEARTVSIAAWSVGSRSASLRYFDVDGEIFQVRLRLSRFMEPLHAS